MTSEEKMREEFEAWDRAVFGSVAEEQVTDEHGEYEDAIIQQCWMAWKASRESLVIELPPAPVPSRRDGTYTIAQSAYHQGQMSVEKSIHAAGVKTK